MMDHTESYTIHLANFTWDLLGLFRWRVILLVITIIFMEIVSNILPILPTLYKYAQGSLRAGCLSHMCMQMAHGTIMCHALRARVWISLDMPCPTHGISHKFSCPSHGISPLFCADPRAARRRSVEPKNWTAHYAHYKSTLLPHPRKKQMQLCVICCINIPSPNEYPGICVKNRLTEYHSLHAIIFLQEIRKNLAIRKKILKMLTMRNNAYKQNKQTYIAHLYLEI